MTRPELEDALNEHTLALFLGADLQREVTGLPSRADLACEMARRRRLDESLSLAEVAQRVSQAGNRFEFTDFIRSALDTTGKSPSAFHQHIVALVKEHGIHTIITTAYDNLLEVAFQQAGVGINRVVRGSDVNFIRPNWPALIYLYGKADQGDTLVVTDRDHSELLRDRGKEPLIDEVRQVFRCSTILFYGYSLSDPDFKFLFDQIAQNRFARIAYTVWPGLPEDDRQMWRDRGMVILDEDPLAILSIRPESKPKEIERDLVHKMAVEMDSIRRQLNEARASLRLIEERKSEYVQGVDVPLQLIKEERRLQAHIAELEGAIAQHLAPQDAPPTPTGSTVSNDGLLESAALPGSASSVSGGVNLTSDQTHIGADVIGRDKIEDNRVTINIDTVNIGAAQPVAAPAESVVDSGAPLPGPIPYVNTPQRISLTDLEKTILQQVYQDFKVIIIEEELSGGYSGVRVLLTVPVMADGRRAARRVTKLGYAPELRSERDRYKQYVGPVLPMRVTQMESERHYELDEQAGLPYIFIGDAVFGDETVDLNKYYRQSFPDAVGQVIGTLTDLLDEKLGRTWYTQSNMLACQFAAEYSRCLVEYLRLKLRPASADRLWPIDQPPASDPVYRRMNADAVLHGYETIQPDTLLSIEGLIITQIRQRAVVLEDSHGQGITVVIEFDPDSHAAHGLMVGKPIGVRGAVAFNRNDRLKEIAHVLFPDLPSGVEDESIQLSCPSNVGESPSYPNPLRLYPEILGKVLEGRKSYTHGDLHLLNVLVDQTGKAWPIDFAKAAERHNLFDFITLETRLRTAELARTECTFSLHDYAQFEEALNKATLGLNVTPPNDPHLRFAYQVIRAIRNIARKYMGPKPDFSREYFPALFLYCLGVTRYYPNEGVKGARLAFTTACVLTRYLLGKGGPVGAANRPPKGDVHDDKPEPHTPPHHLPPKAYHRLVGRLDELDKIMSALREPEGKPIVAIFGLGGIGKTALAREAVERCQQERLFDYVVWTSAKTEWFVGEGTTQTGGSVYSFDEFLGKIGRQCDRLDIAQLSPEQKQAAVKHLLASKRILIVMDNLETASEGEKPVADMFQILGKSKLLLTGRHHIKHERVFTLDLSGFPEDEGVTFLREESKERGIEVVLQAARPILVEIHQVTGGAPLAMKLVAGQISRQPLSVVLETLKKAAFRGQDYEFYRFVYQHSWAILDLNARMCLVDMSVFPPLTGGTVKDVEEVSQVESSAFWPAMDQLVTLSLVDKAGEAGRERYALHPLTQYFIRSDITKEWAG